MVVRAGLRQMLGDLREGGGATHSMTIGEDPCECDNPCPWLWLCECCCEWEDVLVAPLREE